MKLPKFVRSIFGNKQVASTVDRVVAALKQTEIGAAVAENIKDLTDKSLTGQQKFEQVVANTIPLILTYAAGGGLPAFVKDAENIARQLTQSTFNDLKGTGYGPLIAALVRKLGL